MLKVTIPLNCPQEVYEGFIIRARRWETDGSGSSEGRTLLVIISPDFGFDCKDWIMSIRNEQDPGFCYVIGAHEQFDPEGKPLPWYFHS